MFFIDTEGRTPGAGRHPRSPSAMPPPRGSTFSLLPDSSLNPTGVVSYGDGLPQVQYVPRAAAPVPVVRHAPALPGPAGRPAQAPPARRPLAANPLGPHPDRADPGAGPVLQPA